MGDSITQCSLWTNAYHIINQKFENILHNILNRKTDVVINTAILGDTTQRTLNNVDQRLNRYSPDTVSTILGANDKVNF